MENTVDNSIVRLLRDIPNTNTTSGSDVSQTPSPRPQGRDVYEFIAFLCWYLFLVLCCVIPALCAYRRRRMRDQRSSLVFMRGTTLDGRPITTVTSQGDGRRIFAEHEERLRAERASRIEGAIKNTTMIVAESDLVEPERNQDMDISINEVEGKQVPESVPLVEELGTRNQDMSIDEVEGKQVPQSVPVDEEVGSSVQSNPAEYESEYEFASLRLPSETGEEPAPNGSRNVPPACTICLCPYEVKDAVTWSPKDHCSHAFHQDCIVQWLEKKEDPLCPVCRQEFCDFPPLLQMPLSTNATNSTPANPDDIVDV